MVGRPEELHAEAEKAGDGCHDSEVLPALLENRSLLDVELEVGADSVDGARLGQAGEVEARLRHRIRDSTAPPVVEVELAAERAAAEHPGLEATPWLFVEGHHPERPLRLDALAAQKADGRERGHDAERPVVAAAPRDGVEVGADENRTGLPGGPFTEDVAGRIELGLEPELFELAHEPIVGLRELRSPGEARDAALVGADLGSGLELSRERGHRASSTSDRARPRP